jgi:hypothetical protein
MGVNRCVRTDLPIDPCLDIRITGWHTVTHPFSPAPVNFMFHSIPLPTLPSYESYLCKYAFDKCISTSHFLLVGILCLALHIVWTRGSNFVVLMSYSSSLPHSTRKSLLGSFISLKSRCILSPSYPHVFSHLSLFMKLCPNVLSVLFLNTWKIKDSSTMNLQGKRFGTYGL